MIVKKITTKRYRGILIKTDDNKKGKTIKIQTKKKEIIVCKNQHAELHLIKSIMHAVQHAPHLGCNDWSNIEKSYREW